MLTVLGYVLITSFLLLVIKQKLSPFTGLIVVSLAVGVLVCLLNGVPMGTIMTWVREGLFYSQNEAGKVSLGTVNPTVMILFAVLYFSLMMNVGLFDPLCTYLIRKANGDPLKIILVTAFTSAVVTLDGDGTTTILIITTAFLPLYKQMGMKLSNLAMLIILPCGLGNCLPWGGPLARAAAVLNLEVNTLFVAILPILGVSFLYVFFMAYLMGIKERKRLGFVKGANGIVTPAQILQMVNVIKDHDKELKRPRLFLFNLALTLGMLVILIAGWASGAVVFMLGTAIALTVNYSAVEQRERITANGGDAVAVASIILAAGCFLGIFNGSGMAGAVAEHMASLIPDSMGSHTALIFAFLGALACYALPVDAYYFGILPVVAPIAYKFGISPTEIGVASFMGQALRYASPTVAWLFLLMNRTEMTFGEYQKEFFKWSIPMFFIFLITAIVTGELPVG
ncbi:TRAP transporter large permease subunit [Pseudomonas syringae]|uniref:TRAP transporter large permease subunit n=1 Tax=Pseudomonas syringae TaxID=317 RepID=A0A9Q3ZZW3_PSESX|nr:TRAP transporter large permease subunit [Pseudomonas syringae]MCF5066444.1 TRAP transporter large permease subunit [Pseudomonas syringae]MCF5072587.1 TRAP transporter large permease subunit [Pseudomonas syringae]MCF5118218.1 TRAP transporter large permease subunit [Pseudomonas syringae]MCF5378295.1 TRAP transporter large permease subunit [Pseudomonas syringae]